MPCGPAICEDGHVFSNEEGPRLAMCIHPANFMAPGCAKRGRKRCLGVQDLTVSYRLPGGHLFNVCDPGG